MLSTRWIIRLTCFVVAAGSGFGNPLDWKDSLRAGMDQHYAGHFAQAEVLLREALEASRRDDKKTEIAETLNRLGDVYLSEDRFTEAEDAYSLALSLYKQSPSTEIGGVVALRGLGMAFAFQGRDQKALSALNKALHEAKTNFTSETQLTAEILNSLGMMYLVQHSYKKAERLFLDVVRRKSAVDGGNDLTTAGALNNLAQIHREQQRYIDAEKEYLECLRITVELLGPSHPQAAITRGGLGLLYLRTGRLDDAKAQLVESLRITAQTDPVLPGRIVRILHMLGEIDDRQGKLAESEEVFARAVETARQNPRRDPETIAVLNAYSAILKRSGKAEQARNVQREADLQRATMALTVRVPLTK
jgi:tetratricopeptide (TPR) repeat protein